MRVQLLQLAVPLPAAPDEQQEKFAPPDLSGKSVMIVASAEIEASLLARRLGRWGARTYAVTQENIAFALLPERAWDTLVVDYPIASSFIASGDLPKLGVQKRIVLIRPTERHELPALKAAGFTGYLVKPVRASQLQRGSMRTSSSIRQLKWKLKRPKLFALSKQRTFHPRRGR